MRMLPNGSAPLSGRWRATGLQAAHSGLVILALVATGWLLALMIAPAPEPVTLATDPATIAGGHEAIRWAIVIGTVTLPLAVLLAVEALQRTGAGRCRKRMRMRTRPAPSSPEQQAGGRSRRGYLWYGAPGWLSSTHE